MKEKITREFPNNKSLHHKRIAIFASFDKDGCVSDIVQYYLRGLKTCVDAIVFVADNEVIANEVDKLSNLVCYASFYRHGEYDFGSYRRGYEWAEKNGLLVGAEELIMCNDSCYGPVFPFNEMFSRMSQESCDFWGIVSSNMHTYHVQSYFLVFRKPVLKSDIFKEIIHGFHHQDSWIEYINEYELKISKNLISAGFTSSSYTEVIEREKRLSHTFGEYNPTIFPETLFLWRIPIIKKKAFTEHCETTLRESIIRTLFCVKCQNPELHGLIEADLQRVFNIGEEVEGLPEWIYIAEKYGGKAALHEVLRSKVKDMSSINVLQAELMFAKQEIKTLKKNESYLAMKNAKHLRQVLLLLCFVVVLCVWLLIIVNR